MIVKMGERIQNAGQGFRSFWAQHKPLLGTDRRKILSLDRTEIMILRGRRAVRAVDRGSREAVILQYRLLTELLKKTRTRNMERNTGLHRSIPFMILRSTCR